MTDLAIDRSSDGDRGAVSAIAATRFGGYTLVAKLGQGAMAEVFLALRTGQAGFRKLVVIKRLHPHLLEEQGVRDMFLDEARLAALLSHANVVQTNEVAEVDGRPFMAMEYLDGQPMSHLVARCMSEGTALPPPVLARIVSDALDGLQHAHDLHDLHGAPLSVVHRDVSPHNLFVCYDGVTKVLDFGVAKASLHAAHTEIGAIKGKYAYLSPEQAEQQEVDARTDVWGMGVVLWECLTGRRLFKRDTEMATLKAVTEEPIPPVRQHAVDAPAELATIAERALQRDLAQRYASAQAMRDDLEEYLRRLPEPCTRREVGRFVRSLFTTDIEERRRAISACVRGEIGETTDAFVLGESTHPSYSNSVSQAVQSGSRSRWTPLLVGLVVLLSVGLAAAIIGPMASRPEQAVVADAAPPERASRPESALASGEAPAGQADEGEARGGGDDATGVRPDPVVADAVEPREPEAQPGAGDGVAGNAEKQTSSRRQERRVPRARQAASEPAQGSGFLYLDTTPWTSVYLGTRLLGDTPLSNVELPAGRHVLSLRNEERGIQQRYTVEIEPGQVTRRRVGLR